MPPETIGDQTKEILLSDYIQVYKITDKEPEFIIQFPDGKPCVCRKPRRYGDIATAQREAKLWWDKILNTENLEATWPEMAERVKEVGNDITPDEITAAFFCRHFMKRPTCNDLEAVGLILCPPLLNSLYFQINNAISGKEEYDMLQEIEQQKKDSRQTIGTTSDTPPAVIVDSETPTN